MLEPFVVSVPDEAIADLHRRLDRTRLPDELSNPRGPWALGTDRQVLTELLGHWRHRFDWRSAEDRLNEWPQTTTVIDGQRIHAIHAQSPEPDATPLLISHGWPGSVAEFLDVIGPLTDPVAHGGSAADAFHVVAPSLPGYGFSGPTTDIGWTPRRMAAAFAELMTRLGYDRFVAQGGDWGSMVTSQLGLHFPERVIGIHLNMVIAPFPKDAADPWAGVTDEEKAALDGARSRFTDGLGYQDIQGTRPQTLAPALVDSPAGLCAWIVEKFHAWADDYAALDPDRLLTNVAIYWFTGTAGSAARLYAETRRGGRGASLPDEVVRVPMGYARFPADGFVPPRAWVERRYDVRHWSVLSRGGHFAAMEEPELFVEDVRAFVRSIR